MIDCLAVMGAAPSDVEIKRGRAWLLHLESRNGEKGRWSDTSADFYCHYHSSWCGVVGLMARVVLGEGPLCRHWDHMAEASAYWAKTHDLVEASPAGLAIEGTPPWNSPLMIQATSSNGLNLGITATGQTDRVFDRFRDRSLLGFALGMHSGHIPDCAITSSSVLSVCEDLKDSSACWPFYARLDKVLGCAGAWVAAGGSGGEWLQIDLGSQMLITGIATQGGADSRDGQDEHFVTAYQLSTSGGTTCCTRPPSQLVGGEVARERGVARGGKGGGLKDGDMDWVLHGENLLGNSDTSTVEAHMLSPISCRFIRIYPKSWVGKISLRVEVYGVRGSSQEEEDVAVAALMARRATAACRWEGERVKGE